MIMFQTIRRVGISVAAICLLSCLATKAQQTQVYTSSERELEDGINLYYQQHYAASERTLSNYMLSPMKQNKELAEFFLAANAFELRQADALSQLLSFQARYPYTTYSSEVNYMLGTLYLEKRKFKQALKYLDNAEYNELSSSHQPSELFNLGYCHIQLNDMKKAAVYFGKLKEQRSLYSLQAQYYYSFCQYATGNYGKALPGFLAIENSELYRDIVPYYIVQIYYQQKQYDEVYERAERLLAIESDSENSGELHRMLGEIYYQQGKYEQAQAHLLAYQQSYSKQGKDLVREDIYLLGMAYFQTGDFENAVRWLGKVKKNNDELSQNACLNMGNAYLKLNDVEHAKLSFGAAMRYNFDQKTKEEAMYNYALTTYQSSSALGESINALTDFLKTFPKSEHSEQAWALLTDAFMTSKNYQAGYDALNQISNPTEQMLDTKQYLRYQLGVEAYLQNDMQAAINKFTEVIDNDKKNTLYKTDSYYWRAEAFYHLRQWDDAQRDIDAFGKQRNAKQSNNYRMSEYLKGYTQFSRQQYGDALNSFSQYIKNAQKSSNTYADALNRIGDCHFYSRNFSKAESCYAQVVALGSTGADYAMFQRGYALGLLKRYTDKINVLEKLVKQYSKSDYADDAVYEIARAHLQKEDNTEAIAAYDRLLADYPRSTFARKAALEKAMIYYNIGEYAQAIDAYKYVISKYPQSEEAYAALDGMQTAYVETNNIAEYLDYTKTLGKSKMNVNNKEDSLTYVTAERQYMLANYREAAEGFKTYTSHFCAGGRYCTISTFYLANCYYQLGDRQQALPYYKELTDMEGNPYIEDACTRAAEITYDNKDYLASRVFFDKLDEVATSTEKHNIARLGVLRCSYLVGDNEKTIDIANLILDDNNAANDVKQEALYNRGKAYYQLGQTDNALADMLTMSEDVRTAWGAEAKYTVAQIYYDRDSLNLAEEQIMDFAKKNTPQQLWLAKSFILLSDICVKRGELFQAKQYLLSLQANYKQQDEIPITIASKLREIEALEKTEESL